MRNVQSPDVHLRSASTAIMITMESPTAYGLTMAAESNPLSPPLEKLTSDLAINTVSAFAAAQEAVKGFEELGSSAPKTFIQIGNMLNKMVYPRLITMGIGKQAAAHTIACCAEAYGGKGWQ